MRSLIKYQSVLLVLVTLMIGYRQLSFPVDLAIRKPSTSKHYQFPAGNKAAGGAVYFEEEREGEDDRFSKKQTDLTDYFLLFDNSRWEFTATTTVVSIVDKINVYAASAHPTFRVLRL